MNDTGLDGCTGSCLCGTVRFRISGAFDHFFLCHCSRCRKDTGAAYAANLFSTNGVLDWLSGEERVTTFLLPSTRHQRSFCGICGAALPGLQMDGRLLVVPAGSLDDAVDMRPDAHICVDSRAAWEPLADDAPRFAGLPGEQGD